MNMHQEQSALTQGVNGPRSQADTGPGPGAGDAGDEGCRVRHRSEAGRVSPREAMGRPCGRGARTVRSTHSCPDLPRRPGQRPCHERDNDPSGPAALTRTCRLFPVSSWDSAWRPLPRTRLTTWLEPRPARTAVPHQPVRGAVPSRGARPPFQNVTLRGGASTTRAHCPTALQAGRPGSRCW